MRTQLRLLPAKNQRPYRQLMRPLPIMGAAALTMLMAACGASDAVNSSATTKAQFVLDEAPD